MVYISGGEFVMGSDAGDEFSRPAHSVTVGPFFIDQTEVTNEDYERFVSATKHTPPPNWTNGEFPEGKGRFPVTGVTWYDAAEFAAWVGKRLPTEEEWEFAARGTDNLLYPWGNEWNPALANVDKRSGGIRAVGEGGKSLFGLFDMAGNAWEWTASDARSFAGGKKSPKSRLHLKIIRGGNWQSDSRTASSVFRGYYGAVGEREYNSTGFRCVRDLRKD
jgi:formylglycine-generating enzyme required for sulfatase activity